MRFSDPRSPYNLITSAVLMMCSAIRRNFLGYKTSDRLEQIKDITEIKLCSMICELLPEDYKILAQGKSGPDIEFKATKIEVKYLRMGTFYWSDTNKDWQWILDGKSLSERKNRIWITFFPSMELMSFNDCLSIPKINNAFSYENHVPFAAITEKEPFGKRHRLEFREPDKEITILAFPGGKKVMVTYVGHCNDPIWGLVYIRITTKELQSLPSDLYRVINIK